MNRNIVTTLLFIAIATTCIQPGSVQARLHDSRVETENNPGDTSGFRVRYIFALGSEGTGHHTTYDIINSSPLHKMMEENGLIKTHREVCKMIWNLVLNGCNGRPSSSNRWIDPRKSNEQSYRDIVTELQKLDKGIQENKHNFNGEGMPEKGVMNVHINLANGCTISLPSFFGRECRDQQYFNLHMFYKACAKVGVECGHIIMVRDAFDVWSSTLRRKHDTPGRLAHTLASTLDSIAAQMLSFGHHLVACWDHDDPKKKLATASTQNLLGWNNIPNGDLDNELVKYAGHSHHYDMDTMAKYEPEESMMYIQSMEITTNLIRNLCREQLSKNGETNFE